MLSVVVGTRVPFWLLAATAVVLGAAVIVWLRVCIVHPGVVVAAFVRARIVRIVVPPGVVEIAAFVVIRVVALGAIVTLKALGIVVAFEPLVIVVALGAVVALKALSIVVALEALAIVVAVVAAPVEIGISGCHYAVAFENTRFGAGANRRRSVIDGSQHVPVLTGGFMMLQLLMGRFDVVFPHRRLLPGRGVRLDPTRPAVETGPVDGGVVIDHRGVVGIVNDGGIHVGDRPVVVKDPAAPCAARKSHAAVAKPIVDPAVEAYVRAPITAIPHIETVAPTPVAGRPEKTNRRRLHPGSGDPIVSVRPIGPITGRPQITGSGHRWLFIDRQRRRPYAD